MSLLGYEKKFSNLNIHRGGGGEISPHQVAMTLAVIELIANGTNLDNRIYFDQRLKDAYSRHGGIRNPHYPFFHLRSAGFWHHYLRPGKADSYAQLSTVTDVGTLNEHVEFAYLDDELYELLHSELARQLLEAALLRNLSPQDRSDLLSVGDDWDWLACEAIVQDYLAMLAKEAARQPYSKERHRLALQKKLKSPTEAAIDEAHRNISAILLELGQLYIAHYIPDYDYQPQLRQVVLAHLAGNSGDFEQIINVADQRHLEKPPPVNWEEVLDPEPPKKLAGIREPERKYLARTGNYTERERRNRELGRQGEEFVIDCERDRLQRLGRVDLAREIVWTSEVKGDGLGYDVRSFHVAPDEEIYIEVKTTGSGKYQPFFISATEVACSKEQARRWWLYRVFDFRGRPRIYRLPGAVESHVHLMPQNFKASFVMGSP